MLGIGQFGVVLLVVNKSLKEESALKIICKNKLADEEIDVIKSESEILKALVGRPNIVQFKMVFIFYLNLY